MSLIKVLVVDNQRIFRDGIKALLKETKEIQVVGEANNGEGVIKCLSSIKVDVILMDIKMPGGDGIGATQYVKNNFPDIKVLALSTYDDEDHIFKMLEAGATGYILKNTGKVELMAAIKTLASGDSYFSGEVSKKILAQIHSKASSPSPQFHTSAEDIPITAREIEVLILIAEGLTNHMIAKKLFISTRTVDTHRRNLLQKLDIHNTAALVKYAYEHGLINATS